ncbi:MAG: hypothetical protein D3922_04220 [Candidatus Electrothrix sp. AR1]|nr:hypothetical protein [Candidatus Electrothrix sp. AR1]
MKKHPNDDLSNAPKSHKRRKTIKKLVVGVGALAGYSVLPTEWTKPIIEQIVLPAHAQTSALVTGDSPLTAPPAPPTTLATIFNRTGAGDPVTVNFESPVGPDSVAVADGDNEQIEVSCPSMLNFSNGRQEVQSCDGNNVWIVT